MRDALGTIEIEHTRGPRDAERLAREAVRAGIERLVIAGGDGTLAEVATGLLRAQLADYAELAVLPMGTGCDFARALGVPRDPEAALAVLRTGKARRIDAGHARYVGRDGAPADSYFLNAASFGVSGLVVELAQRGAKWLGGTRGVRARDGARALALPSARAWRCASTASSRATRRSRSSPRRTGASSAAECRSRRTRASTTAGSTSCGSRTRRGLRLIPKLPKLYRGTHLADPVVRARRGRRIEADAAPGAVPLELDGEPLGALPAQIELLPGAISVVGPTA